VNRREDQKKSNLAGFMRLLGPKEQNAASDVVRPVAGDAARLQILTAKVADLERRSAERVMQPVREIQTLAAKVAELEQRLAEGSKPPAGTGDVDALSAKVAELERRLTERAAQPQPSASKPLGEAEVDAALQSLGERLIGTHPSGRYFNVRFRGYEWAMRNVKQMGYELGLLLAEKHGLGRKVAAAPKTDLKSKLCTQADCDSDWFTFWLHELKARPHYHRKQWEFAYIAQALWQHGKLKPGLRGVGFGCGVEPLPSLFAKYGATVVATDMDPAGPGSKEWAATQAGQVGALRNGAICPDNARLMKISLEFVDMNDIPARLHGQFDFCWSSCALEHLGTLDKGLLFIENSLKTLKPGGVAVHTTEYNLEQEGATLDNWSTVLYQRRHLEPFVARLKTLGYRVAPLDLDAGNGILDRYVDIPPFEGTYYPQEANWAHLKLCVAGLACTSAGLIITKP